MLHCEKIKENKQKYIDENKQYSYKIPFHDDISSVHKRSFIWRGELGRIIVMKHLTESDIIYLMEDFFWWK